MKVYKIVEKVSEDKYKFLFHDRKRVLSSGSKVEAKKKMVYESYDRKTGKPRLYLSGIHVIQTEELCKKYLKRFKDKSNKVIVYCEAKRVRKKPRGNPGVLLSDSITLLKETI